MEDRKKLDSEKRLELFRDKVTDYLIIALGLVGIIENIVFIAVLIAVFLTRSASG